MRRLIALRYWVFVVRSLLRFIWRGFGQWFRKATGWDGFWWVASIVVILVAGADGGDSGTVCRLPAVVVMGGSPAAEFRGVVSGS